jgi:hypothetical protein
MAQAKRACRSILKVEEDNSLGGGFPDLGPNIIQKHQGYILHEESLLRKNLPFDH